MTHKDESKRKFIPLSDQELKNLLKIQREIEDALEKDIYNSPPYIKDMHLYIDGYPDSFSFHLN